MSTTWNEWLDRPYEIFATIAVITVFVGVVYAVIIDCKG